MKRLILVAAVLVLAVGLFCIGAPCAKTGKIEVEGKQTNLLITHNTPAIEEWGGKQRRGIFFMGLGTACEAAQSGEATNVAVVFLPEASDAIEEGALDGYALSPGLREYLNVPVEVDNLTKLCRYLKKEFGVTFYGWDLSIARHEIMLPDFIEPISCDEYVTLVVNADRIAAF